MKTKIKSATVDALHVHSVGATFSDGSIPVQFDYDAKPLPEKPVLPEGMTDAEHQAIMAPWSALAQKRDEIKKASQRKFPAGTVIKAGDYVVTVNGVERIVDGPFFESVCEPHEEPLKHADHAPAAHHELQPRHEQPVTRSHDVPRHETPQPRHDVPKPRRQGGE